MGGLMEMIQKMLGSGTGGIDQFGANANGKIMPGGMTGAGSIAPSGNGSPGSFNQGLMDGMLGGNPSGRGRLDTSASDHALGMSALSHYQDMSHTDDSLGKLSVLSNMNYNRPWKVQEQEPANAYVQYLMSGMRGGR